MTDRQRLTVLTLAGFALVGLFIVATGCTHKPTPAEDALAHEASAAAIDAKDIPVHDNLPNIDDPLKPDPDPETNACHCCKNCECGDRCVCIIGKPCSPDCTCCPKPIKPKSPWVGQALYRTPFYCPQCGHFSVYMAPLSLRSTKCEECRNPGAIRTEFEYQRRAREQRLYRGAAMNYRSSAGGC